MSGSWIERSVLPKLLKQKKRPFVSVLVGPRQVGKTVLLRMIQKSSARKTTYLDLENPQDALVLARGLDSLLQQLGSAEQILFLDEFHRIPDALSLFKQLYDNHPGIKVYASGSSSIEIHAHLRQSAVGRVRRTRIFPLSFPEWSRSRVDLNLWGRDPAQALPPREGQRLLELLEEFVIWGGMPELLSSPDEMDKREALAEICALYIEKDIRSLLKEQDVMRFNEFLRLICILLGQQMNRSSFGKQLGISSRQVEKQLKIMEHTYVLRLAKTDYDNPGKRLVKAPKIYFYDNGIRNALIRDFRPRALRPDAGALLENHVFCEMEKAAGVDVDIHYHRTQDGQEIDFILERDRQKLVVEVKSRLHRETVPRAIRELLKRADVKGAVVLNDRLHSEVEVEGKTVLFLPVTLCHLLPGMLRAY